jgi:hypothetical protein
MKARFYPYAVVVSLALPLFVFPIFAQLATTPWPMFHHDIRRTGQSQKES